MSDCAIAIENLGKMYRLYSRQADKVIDALGIGPYLFWRKKRYHEFWALRDVTLNVSKGERVGIIGRNGAGKSTLLKLITGNVSPTEGKVNTAGRIQALMELGTGFHPEFTGRQNISAALSLQGYGKDQIKAKEAEIVEFAEVDEFIDQPIKTYSAGMYARLAFSTATAIEPEILIIDEVLGAGDAYFAGKCIKRMEDLTEGSGATVLFVSHDMSSVQRLCQKIVWVDRGRIVMTGSGIEVVKAYSQFIMNLEDQRLKAKNQKRISGGYDLNQLEGYGDVLSIVFVLRGRAGTRFDISEIALCKDSQVEEKLQFGDAHDVSGSAGATLVMEGSQWSGPRKDSDGCSFRSLTVEPERDPGAIGQLVFQAYLLSEEARYELSLQYRNPSNGKAEVVVYRNGVLLMQCELPQAEGTRWSQYHIAVIDGKQHAASSVPRMIGRSGQEDLAGLNEPNACRLRRWPSQGTITIKNVRLIGEKGKEQTIFPIGSQMTLEITVVSQRHITVDFVPTATLFRIDGVLVSNFIGQPVHVEFEAEKSMAFKLVIPEINLGDGHYVFSIAIYDEAVDETHRFDLIDRSFEFQVVGNDPGIGSILFHHSNRWQYPIA